jgi:hypothetical protein
MTYATSVVRSALVAYAWCLIFPFQAQITWEFAEPIDVASSRYGNRCPHLVLDASGATIHKASCTPSGSADLPSRFLATPTLFVQAESTPFPILLRLGKTD